MIKLINEIIRPKIAENQPFLVPKKSVFNKIIGDNPFELEFSSFCENKFDDVVSFAKNTFGEGGVNFSIEYQKENGNIASFFPDFFIKTSTNTFYILETKGREDLDDIRKIKRLAIWCKTITIELTDFVTHYTQDDIEDIQQSMRAGSKVVIEDGQITKIEKDKNGIITRTVLTENWFDWIDYWAIDFNYEDKKEIIKLSELALNGLKDERIQNSKTILKSFNPTNLNSDNEYWTGNYLFENEWQVSVLRKIQN